LKEICWAEPIDTAIPGQTVTELGQDLSNPSFSKNEINIVVLQCRTYQI